MISTNPSLGYLIECLLIALVIILSAFHVFNQELAVSFLIIAVAATKL